MEGWISSQSGTANICPPPLGHRDVSSPSSLLPPSSRHSSVLRRGSQSRRGRPGRAPKAATEEKVSPPVLPEVTEVQQPGKAGLCIFKTSEGASWPSSKAQVQGKK